MEKPTTSEVILVDVNSIDENVIEEYVIEDSSDENEDTDMKDVTNVVVVEDTEMSDAMDEVDIEIPELPDVKVGLMDEAFVVLKNTSVTDKNNLKSTLCSLLIGEIRLAQKYEKYKGKIFGYTEGIGKNSLHEPKKMASKAVIFMVISLTENWKIPVGLFLVHNPDIKYFADTIEETLERLHKNGITIISVTLNCVSPHLSFALAEELGAEMDSSKHPDTFKAFFPHPTTSEETVHILYDLDIILSCIKSYWTTEKVMRYKTKTLDYSLCTAVKRIKEKDVKHFRTDTIYDWIIIKKRLSLETETFGKQTADAMQYLKDLKHSEFERSGPTIQFVRIFDLITQLSRINGQSTELYPNLSKSNEQQWKPLILSTITYIKGLRSLSRDTPQHLSVIRTCVAGLIVYFRSLLHIYAKHVDTNNTPDQYVLPSLLPSRFGSKHIRIGMLENRSGKTEMTALSMFLKIKQFAGSLHFIDN